MSYILGYFISLSSSLFCKSSEWTDIESKVSPHRVLHRVHFHMLWSCYYYYILEGTVDGSVLWDPDCTGATNDDVEEPNGLQ
jgi:hypothetical protein